MANYDLTNLAVQMLAPNNKVLVDDTDLPSIMVYIPKFRLCDVLNTSDTSVHPAFMVNGTEIDGFYYSKYQNVVHNNVAYSLPGEDPAININLDTARSRSEAKGSGWHLSTIAEWAAIALWCKKSGFLPYGNNNYGKDSREAKYKAIPSMAKDSGGRTQRVATGTGPLTWSHDKTVAGIWDMNGNVNEWQGGIRLVWGELQILANNDAADPDNPQNTSSTCWKAINATDGSLVDPECNPAASSGVLTGTTVRLDWENDKWQYSNAITNPQSNYKKCLFGDVTCSAAIGDAVKILLRALALLPDEGTAAADYEDDYMYWNHGAAERCVYRGGLWSISTDAGLFYLSGSSDRSNSNTGLGFRTAYIPEIG